MKMKPAVVKCLLNRSILKCVRMKDSLVKRPGKDFSRNRILSFKAMLILMLKFSGLTLQNEISAHFLPIPGNNTPVPTKSAFVQQRNKILPEAGYKLLRFFTGSLPQLLTFMGYRLLAVDGSKVPIPYNEKEKEYSTYTGKGRKSYSMAHINSLFDILNRVFVDCIIDPGMHGKERKALAAMASRLPSPEKCIIVADRGYEGFNAVAHLLESNVKFAIRAKDIDSNGFLSTLDLPETGEFDVIVRKKLVSRIHQRKKGDSAYVKVSLNHFDYLSDPNDAYEICFRIVRVMLPNNTSECIVTNLPEEEFTKEMLRELYHLRWSIENAYRDLKYTIDLLHFHGKSAQSVLLEIYLSMVFFNYCAYISVHCDPLEHKSHTKYFYKVNFANAVDPCRDFFHNCISEAELLRRLKLCPTPIRENRYYPRPSRLKEQSARGFNYRPS